ncbi:MAG: TolC family protein [Bacteroidaceae bacterium]
MRGIICICILSLAPQGLAQRIWTIDQCIQYAVEHNHEVRLQGFTLEDRQAERQGTLGALLPAIEGSIGGQYNFGRAIDPETNTYTNVSTFYNGYNLSASVPVFDGLQRINNLRAARTDVLMGRSQLQALKDATAQQVLQTCTQILYYQGCVGFALQKRQESELLLRQTQVMAELGQKGEADVAQMQATYAADDFEVTHQQGLLDKALLTLKRLMNYPLNDSLQVAPCEELSWDSDTTDGEALYSQARLYNPTIRQTELSLRSARYAYRASRGALFPSLFLGAGVSTTYYKQLGSMQSYSFQNQFRNNAGEYVYATLSFPLFGRLSTLSNIRRKRNSVRRAQEQLDHQSHELQKLILETITDRQNSFRESEKMRLKVEADSIANRLTIRKYEEGLASSIDVQTSSVTLLQSRAQWLNSQLNYMYNQRMLSYYKGIPLWTE